MQENIADNNIQKIYSRIILLASLAHLSFAVFFALLLLYHMVIYNLLSMTFYICLVVLLKRNRYCFITTAIHLEISLFVTVTSVYLGWNTGFSFYLIALCCLVYFSSYKNTHFPFILSACEAILFVLLKIHCYLCAPFLPLSETTTLFFYCYNAVLCFFIILYAAYISNLSSLFSRRELLEKNYRLQTLLDHDELTQLYTRNYIKKKFLASQEKSSPVHLAMADIDNFKYINDTYGHPCGDYVLFTLSTIFKTVCPPDTDICRWGGEEFVIVMYDREKESSINCIQKLRESISAYDFNFDGNHFHITMTFGIGSTLEQNDFAKLIRLADTRMYQGKKSGKNIVIAH